MSVLTYVLIYAWTKCVLENGSENFVKLASTTEFTVKEVTIFRVSTF